MRSFNKAIVVFVAVVLFALSTVAFAQKATPIPAPSALKQHSPAPPTKAQNPELTQSEKVEIKEGIHLLTEADLSYQLAVAKEAQYKREKTDLEAQITSVLRKYRQARGIPENWGFDFNNMMFVPPSNN